MKQPEDQVLMIELEHTGERLAMWRTRDCNGIEELQMTGRLPAHQQGPPLHIHFREDEHTKVVAGTLSASVDGKDLVVEAGGSACFPKGSVHRWWNDGDEELVFQGVAAPAVDLDRYLQALFEVINAGGSNHPSVFYMAHLICRHRHTHLALGVPRALQRVLFPMVVVLGTLLGKYRGTGWPGCPDRCTGGPIVSPAEA